jgi:molybdopterin/thiamine biosynthesis adenylyltransferase
MGKNLGRKLSIRTNQQPIFKPEIFNLIKPADQRNLEKLFKHGNPNIIDDYQEQLKELFAVNNPKMVYTPDFEKNFALHLKILQSSSPLWRQGRWIYYSWLNHVVHVLIDKDFQALRTARNRNLINADEQKKFYNAVVGIGGLSVGNSVALALVLQGGARHLRLADFDRLALTNTNRIRAGVQNLGLPKVVITARQIYELNPYAKVEIFTDGLNKKNIKKFFNGPPKLDVIVDELDNLAIKFLLRQYAKKGKIPVVMAADNGDNAVVDVERFDLNPKTPFFHGRIGRVSFDYLKNLDKFGIGKTITRHIGAENVTKRVQESLLEMGKTIVSWPQLGGAAQINGAAAAYVIRKILNGQPVERNRALVSLDEKLIPGYNSPKANRGRAKSASDFKKIFGLK